MTYLLDSEKHLLLRGSARPWQFIETTLTVLVMVCVIQSHYSQDTLSNSQDTLSNSQDALSNSQDALSNSQDTLSNKAEESWKEPLSRANIAHKNPPQLSIQTVQNLSQYWHMTYLRTKHAEPSAEYARTNIINSKSMANIVQP